PQCFNEGDVVVFMFFCFFFQAEDGIRDYKVTGVQTCALPILISSARARIASCRPGIGGRPRGRNGARACGRRDDRGWPSARAIRSEERRVGKECRSRWWPED